MRIKVLIVLVCLVFLSGTANGATVTLSGSFNDPGNTALVGSGLGPALFGIVEIDSYEYDLAANNVAIYPLSISVPGDVTFTSKGYAAGGAMPYFSLFEGSDRDTAMFLDSNYYISDIDFELTRYMTAGSHWIAIGVWMNMSRVENSIGLEPPPDPPPTKLGDGFTGLGVPEYLGDLDNYPAYYAYYELEVTMPDQSVPEPGTFWLILSGLAGLIGVRKRFLQIG